MATKRKAITRASKEALAIGSPRSAAVAAKGIRTGHDFANLMSALMSDLIEVRVAPNIGNATCNAGGKLLKVVEMQIKYGVAGEGQQKILTLSLESPMTSNVLQEAS